MANPGLRHPTLGEKALRSRRVKVVLKDQRRGKIDVKGGKRLGGEVRIMIAQRKKTRKDEERYIFN